MHDRKVVGAQHPQAKIHFGTDWVEVGIMRLLMDAELADAHRQDPFGPVDEEGERCLGRHDLDRAGREQNRVGNHGRHLRIKQHLQRRKLGENSEAASHAVVVR